MNSSEKREGKSSAPSEQVRARRNDWRSSPPRRRNHRADHSSGGESDRDESVHLDDSRSISSSQHYPSDSGYHSSGALSDGGGGRPQRSSRFGGRSVGSHGSSSERYNHQFTHNRQHSWGGGRGAPPPHFYNGETRFPTALHYAGSEAAKSDIATVCSGSVVEDIDVSSVASAGDYIPPHTPTTTTTDKFSNNTSIANKFKRSSSGGLPTTPRSVEISASIHTAGVANMPPALPLFAGALAARASPPQQDNDMGPPLSRTLLLQQQQQQNTSSSRAGSVYSVDGSQRSVASSDVIAHVDTDDCGGSLVESDDHDGSQHGSSSNDPEESNNANNGNDHQGNDDEGQLRSDVEASATGGTTTPTLHNGLSSRNGRTSPGGTVYKGRGVRRYQGRYMNLPMKRFEQNGVEMSAVIEQQEQNNDGYHYYNDHQEWHNEDDYRGGARPPPPQQHFVHNRERSRSPPPPRGRNDGYRHGRSRSRSPPPNRTRKGGGRNNRYRNGWNHGPNSGDRRNTRSNSRNRSHSKSPNRSHRHRRRSK